MHTDSFTIEDFAAASSAVESAAMLINLARMGVENPALRSRGIVTQRGVYKLLVDAVAKVESAAEVIEGAADQLAAVSDGVIYHGGRCYASAHEAMLSIWPYAFPEVPIEQIDDSTCERLLRAAQLWTVPADEWHSLIRRERAKLLRQQPTIDNPRADAVDELAANSLDARAVALYLDHPEWTKKRLAEKLKCHVKSLTKERCPKLTAAIKAYTARPDSLRRGTKDREGNLEAWDG